MTVYTPQLPDGDVSSLAQYGELVAANTRYVYADEVENERMPRQFEHHLECVADNFDPAADYMLIAGDFLQIAALAAMLGARHKEFRVLRWDRQEKGYYAVSIRGGKK